MIICAATPIGNDRDATLRLVEEIQQADIIAAEDTRRFLNLASRLGVKVEGNVVSYYEHNEAERGPYLIAQAAAGKRVLMVTDAGMPSVSDPGYRLVHRARAEGVPVTIAPGPSAVLTAVAASGLATDRFSFDGFLPRKDSDIRQVCAGLKNEVRTSIFFESPRRLSRSLEIFTEELGADRMACVCRELTKIHEEVKTAPLGELAEYFQGDVLGEIVLVVSGVQAANGAGGEVSSEDMAAAVADCRELHRLGLRLKDAASYVAARTGISKKELYEESVK